MLWLLDTNILIAASKAHPVVLPYLKKRTINELLLSSVVWAEIQFGIAKSTHQVRNQQVFDSIARHLKMVPFSPQAARHYGQIRTGLERQGTPIGPNDMLIAAEALAQDAILVSDNVREFSRVKGLRLENWMRPMAKT